MEQGFKIWVDAMSHCMEILDCKVYPQQKELLRVWEDSPEAVRVYFEEISRGECPESRPFEKQPDCDLEDCKKWFRCRHFGACVDCFVMSQAAGWWMLTNDFIPVQTEPVTVGG